LQSGNLNYTVPLFTAVGRAGQKLPFALTYNSQNWRYDATGHWKLGADTGYGFGWKLQAGSLKAYYEDSWTVHHYVYTDASGAEYRLDFSNGTQWSSNESVYVWYEPATSKLWFKDGSHLLMTVVSSGWEADAGVRYPYIYQDSNGNQIVMKYGACYGCADWLNSSGRITEVVDARAPLTVGRTYRLTYTAETTPHLSGITNEIGTSETFAFAYSGGQALTSPFSGGTAMGSGLLLTDIGTSISGLSWGPGSYHFEYGADGGNSAGEMSLAQTASGAAMKWEYGAQTYSNGKSFREVTAREVRMKSNGEWWRYSFPHETGAPGFYHETTQIVDPSGQATHEYTFKTEMGSRGLVKRIDEKEGTRIRRRREFTWALSGSEQDYIRQSYIKEVVTTLEPGQAGEKKMKSTQGISIFGNVEWSKQFESDADTTPAKSYTYSYVTNPNYHARYMLDRLVEVRMTPAGGTEKLLTKLGYDEYGGRPGCPAVALADRSGIRQHDTANYPATQTARGNVTSVETMARPAVECRSYDIGGNVVKSGNSAGIGSSQAEFGAQTNYVAPSALTPNANGPMGETLSYSPFLGVTSQTGPNGAGTTVSYDAMARPTATMGPHGAVTTYVYTYAPNTVKATTNGKWVKTTSDGFGRPLKVEKGNGSTTVSVVDYEYAPCACSPIGKLKRESRPYAPGGTVYWTTYEFDGLGRVTQVTGPGGVGVSTSVWTGNVQRVTDPAGRWKEYTKDGLGRLVKVTEPDPAQAGAVHETVYAWNGFDKLTQVTMTRGPVTQVRTFVYDARMRLVSETHPETGTKSYGYDELNRLTAKTDAKNQQVKSIYDNYHRVVRMERYPVANGAEDLAQRTEFTYDTGTGTNLMGRVSEIVYGDPASSPVKERFSYTAAGLVTEKTLVPGAHPSLVGQWTWDNEGKMLTKKYPNWAYWDSGLHPVAGETFVYTYDAMGMASGMALDTGAGYVTSAAYNAAGQMTQLVRGAGLGSTTETWQYDARGLMANDNGTQYTYGDDGKVVTKTGPVAGETIGYSYDALGRLATATANTWGLAWDYDGFGNRYAQRVTKGSAPVVSFPVDKTKNRLIGSGWSYDANGNATSTPAVSYLNYDIENRVTLEQANWYSPAYTFTYDAANRRLTENGVFHFYGLNGELLGQYEKKNDGYASNSNMHMRRVDNSQRVWFAGRLVKKGGATITTDRLGSVATEYGSAVLEYYPYGEEVAATTNDGREKFATYRRDATGLDYAWNRMYSATYGRFLSADPYRASASMTNPQSWNRYAYVENDPVNYNDPEGLSREGVPYNPFDGYDGLIAARLNSRHSPTAEEIRNLGRFQHFYMITAAGRLRLRKAAEDAVNNMSEGCKRVLSGDPIGINLPSLSTVAGKAEFLDVAFFGNFTSSFVVGGDDRSTLGTILGNYSAYVLGGPRGTITNVVVYGSSLQSVAQTGVADEGQRNLLIHEALHIYNLTGDIGLARALGLGKFQDEKMASRAIDSFLERDCQ
jgi:RHS repeat-associated protein